MDMKYWFEIDKVILLSEKGSTAMYEIGFLGQQSVIISLVQNYVAMISVYDV